MRANPLRSRLEHGQVALGGWLSMPSLISAEVMGAAGFDYVNIDMQHGLVSSADLAPMLQALSIGTSSQTVRVPVDEPGIIGKALDAGAVGVIVPMVNTADQCNAALQAGFYAPTGERSFGPVRASMIEGPDYFDNANSNVMIIPMIETVEALSNLDDILSVDGVETIYVGPADLAISLGLRPGTNDPAFDDALAEIVAACKRHDVVPGIHATAELCADRQSRGFRMVTVSADLVGLRKQVAADFATSTATTNEQPDSLY